jgi:pyruvate formate lyase activating enzyme
MKEAVYYEKLKEGRVQCGLCPHNCVIKDGNAGICGVRFNRDGVLYTDIYEMVSSLAVDPIEKKPLSYYKPGTYILSVGTYGCNFSCKFCQNYGISGMKPELRRISADELCDTAARLEYNIGIAFTYNEPFIGYEYMLETFKKNKKNGMDNVIVTNGFVNPEPLMEIMPFVDAMNIDLKAMDDGFYRKICGGRPEPVKRTIAECCGRCHVEITNMSMPGMNDSDEEMEEMCHWIASLDKEMPLHIIPFRPMYKMKNRPGQTYGRLMELKKIAERHLYRVVV